MEILRKEESWSGGGRFEGYAEREWLPRTSHQEQVTATRLTVANGTGGRWSVTVGSMFIRELVSEAG